MSVLYLCKYMLGLIGQNKHKGLNPTYDGNSFPQDNSNKGIMKGVNPMHLFWLFQMIILPWLTMNLWFPTWRLGLPKRSLNKSEGLTGLHK